MRSPQASTRNCPASLLPVASLAFASAMRNGSAPLAAAVAWLSRRRVRLSRRAPLNAWPSYDSGWAHLLPAVRSPLTKLCVVRFSTTSGPGLEGATCASSVCVVMLCDTDGKSRLFGLATVLPLFAYGASCFSEDVVGDLPEALKLLSCRMVGCCSNGRSPPKPRCRSTHFGFSDVRTPRHGSSQD